MNDHAPENAASSRSPAMQMVVKELFSDRKWLSNVMLATLLVNLLGISTSLFSMQVYDRVIPTMAMATLFALVCGMLLAFVLDWVLRLIRTRIVDAKGSEADQAISAELYERLLDLRLDGMPRSVGTLAAQISGLDSVRQFFSAGVVFSIVDLPFALVNLVVIALIGGKIALVYGALFVLAMTWAAIAQFRLRKHSANQLHRSHERQGILVDSIRGAETIRATQSAAFFSKRWNALSEDIAEIDIQSRAIRGSSSVVNGGLASIAYVAAIVVGVLEVSAGELTSGAIIACTLLGGRIVAPVAQAAQYVTQWQQVQQSLKSVDTILKLPRQRDPQQSLLQISTAPDLIRVDNLRFGYAGSAMPQLSIPEMEFRSGERVILAGPVGSGKSTLLKVLAGLYPPSEGRVRLSGLDLWEIDPNQLAAHITYVPQAVYMFKGSLRENIVLTAGDYNESLARICSELGIDTIAAESARGMERGISEGGEGLSGGQRQLVALARAMAMRPAIWLMDEPTAALDAETEKRVWDVLARHLDPTAILIVATHRPAAMAALANRMILMRRGQVVRDDKPSAFLGNSAPAAGVVARDGGLRIPNGVMDVI